MNSFTMQNVNLKLMFNFLSMFIVQPITVSSLALVTADNELS